MFQYETDFAIPLTLTRNLDLLSRFHHRHSELDGSQRPPGNHHHRPNLHPRRCGLPGWRYGQAADRQRPPVTGSGCPGWHVTMYHMYRNGRSNQQFIITASQARAARWERLFGVSHLPVLHAQPRWQQVPGRGTMLAYDLDLSALHPACRRRLAAHVYRRMGRSYASVAAELETAISWPIDADGCEAMPVAERTLAFLFAPGMMVACCA